MTTSSKLFTELHPVDISCLPQSDSSEFSKHIDEIVEAERRNYKEQRKKLRREVGVGKMRLDRLLGGPKMLKHTMEYLTTTGRLEI